MDTANETATQAMTRWSLLATPFVPFMMHASYRKTASAQRSAVPSPTDARGDRFGALERKTTFGSAIRGLRRVIEDILIQEEEHRRDLQTAIGK